MRLILGYNRYGEEVKFSWEPDARFRYRYEGFSPTKATPYDHVVQFMVNMTVFTFSFLAGRSSGITCLGSGDIWASCGPIYGLGIPLIISVLIFVHAVTSDWWTARRAKRHRSQ